MGLVNLKKADLISYNSNPINPFYNGYFFNFANSQTPIFNFNSSLGTDYSKLFYTNFDDNMFNTNNFSNRTTGKLGIDLVNNAKQYLGYKESDNSYKLFTNGRTEHWCADFVTYNIKETYKKYGKKAPIGNFSSVEQYRQYGIKNNCYLKTEGKSNKKELIASNVKPGDVVIFKIGRSHTGIVTKVNDDGSFETIEGNTKYGKVANREYSANEITLSGFVQVC